MRAGLAALAALAAGCAKVDPPAGAASPALDGVWQVEDVDFGGVIDRAMLRLEFAAAGRVSGRAGCNNFTGPLAYENGLARFGPLAVTEKLCAPALMNLEAKMLHRLQQPLRASFDDTGALILADGEGRLLLRRMDAAAPDGAVRAIGEILWDAAAPPPDSAVLTVTLIDISRADAAAVTLAETVLSVDGGPPATFMLASAGPVDPRARLSVSARIADERTLYFISDTHNPVSPEKGAPGMTIVLKAVAGPRAED